MLNALVERAELIIFEGKNAVRPGLQIVQQSDRRQAERAVYLIDLDRPWQVGGFYNAIDNGAGNPETDGVDRRLFSGEKFSDQRCEVGVTLARIGLHSLPAKFLSLNREQRKVSL